MAQGRRSKRSVPMASPSSPEPDPDRRSLRIAYACIRYHPAPGGAETHVRALAQLMAAKGHEVTVHTSDLYTEVPLVRLKVEHYQRPQPQGPSENGTGSSDEVDDLHREAVLKNEEWDGAVRVRRYRASTLSGELHYPIMSGMVTALLKETVDVVHVHSYGYFQTLAGALKRRLQRGRRRDHDGQSGQDGKQGQGGKGSKGSKGGNLPILVFTPHFHPPWSMWGGSQRRAIRERIFDPVLGRWSVNCVDGLVGVSAHELELLQQWVGFDGNRSVVIPNGIHLDHWEPQPSGKPFLEAFGPALWGRSDGAEEQPVDEAEEDEGREEAKGAGKPGPLVLYAGRLASNKGLSYLLQTMPGLTASEPDLRLALVGADTGEGERLSQQARELGVSDKVLITGHLDDVLYRSAFGAADIFVLPSEYEAFGIVLLEAGIMGLPCVGTRVGGVPEVIVEGQTGLIVEYADVKGLGSALSRLLDDPRLRRDMGVTARSRVMKQFGWQSVVERVEALYLRLLDGQAP